MRCASPSTMAVLPTRGWPTSTGLFFGAAAQDLNYTFEFTFTAHQRIQLAVPGGLGQSARELAQ